MTYTTMQIKICQSICPLLKVPNSHSDLQLASCVQSIRSSMSEGDEGDEEGGQAPVRCCCCSAVGITWQQRTRETAAVDVVEC